MGKVLDLVSDNGSMQSLTDKSIYFRKVQKLQMLRHLSASGVEFLMANSEFLLFGPGEYVVTEGDLSPSFFGLLDGSVTAGVQRDGKEVFFGNLGPGDVFGETSLFMNAPRTADIRALEPTVVFKLTRFSLTEFLRRFPEDGNKVLLSVIYSILKKLGGANQGLAFERQGGLEQAEADALFREVSGN